MDTAERRQRIHELTQAYNAARTLEQRIELCVSWRSAQDQQRQARKIRETIAAELILSGKPMADFGA